MRQCTLPHIVLLCAGAAWTAAARNAQTEFKHMVAAAKTIPEDFQTLPGSGLGIYSPAHGALIKYVYTEHIWSSKDVPMLGKFVVRSWVFLVLLPTVSRSSPGSILYLCCLGSWS